MNNNRITNIGLVLVLFVGCNETKNRRDRSVSVESSNMSSSQAGTVGSQILQPPIHHSEYRHGSAARLVTPEDFIRTYLEKLPADKITNELNRYRPYFVYNRAQKPVLLGGVDYDNVTTRLKNPSVTQAVTLSHFVAEFCRIYVEEGGYPADATYGDTTASRARQMYRDLRGWDPGSDTATTETEVILSALYSCKGSDLEVEDDVPDGSCANEDGNSGWRAICAYAMLADGGVLMTGTCAQP